MKNNNQKGVTFIGLMILLLLIGITVLTVLKVAPVYMEYGSVASSMEALEEDSSIKRMLPYDITSLLLKKLDINAVTSVTRKQIKVLRSVDDIFVEVQYEVRENYIGNVDIVISFHEKFTVKL